jgi:hypothetical protein
MSSIESEFLENIDRLITVEVRMPWMPKGVVRKLYARARGEKPLTQEIAEAILERPGGQVGIFTGIVDEYLPKGEIDGPIGAAVLGRALSMLGYRVSIFVEEPIISVLKGVCEALEWNDYTIVNTSAFADDNALQGKAEVLDIAVAIEKLGVNDKGLRHSMQGRPLPPALEPSSDRVFERLNALGKVTIGMADGGNEIGCGKLYEYARQIVPRGADCGCPCHSGIVTTTPARYLLPAATSNWGAYGVVAALGLICNHDGILLRPDEELPVLHAALDAGCVDGGTGLREPAQDGVPGEASAALVALLGTIVSQAKRTFIRHF